MLRQVLDEPAAVQSDASVLALKLRQLGKGAAAGAGGALDVVGRVAHGADQAQRARSINAWVSSVTGVLGAYASTLCMPRLLGRTAVVSRAMLCCLLRRPKPSEFLPTAPHMPRGARCRDPQEAPSHERLIHHGAARHRRAHAGECDTAAQQ